MREILFRGRTTQGKEWISGYYAKSSELHFIWGRNSFGSMLMFEVDPENVGQFTGLTDKNGKKIFEGDIVVSYSLFGRKDGCGIVNWNNLFSAWEIGGKTMYGTSIAIYEVIGNIHDNPELLEG